MLSVKHLQFGCKTLSYAAVKNIPFVAPVLDRVTGGRVNAQSLAQGVWRSGIEVAQGYAVDAKVLGERSARVVPPLLKALVDNDRDQMASAIRQLTSDALDLYVSKDAPGARGWLNASLHAVASGVTEHLTVALLGDHAVEKILATTVANHGMAPFEHFLRANLGTFPGCDAVTRQALAFLGDTLADPAYVQTESATYSTLADLVHVALRGGTRADYLDVLKTYAPRSVATFETLQQVAQEGVVRTGRRVVAQTLEPVLEDAQRGLGRLVSRPLDQAYGARPSAPLASLAATATDRDVADALLHRMAHLSAGTPGTPGTPETNLLPDARAHRAVLHEIASLDGVCAPGLSARLCKVADALSPAQLNPFGPKGEIRVGKTWTGQVAEIRGTNRLGPLRDGKLRAAMRDGLDHAPADFTRWNGRAIGKHFAATRNELNLTIGANKSPALGDDALHRLFDTCGRDAALMREATRYLDEKVAESALAKPLIMRLADARTGLVKVGGVLVEVAELAQPRYRFKVRRADGAVRVALEARWPIQAFGPSADALRLPLGAHQSYLSARAGVTLRRAENSVLSDSASVLTEFDAKGVRAVVENVIAFDSHTGAMPERAADGFVWVPEHVDTDELPFIGAGPEWDVLAELGMGGR